MINHSDYTLMAWAKREATGVNDYIMGQGSAANNVGLQFGFTSANSFVCGQYTNDLYAPLSTYTDSNWHHFACTYNKLTRKKILYIDGIEVAEMTTTVNYSGTGDFQVGRTTWGNYFTGKIDEAQVWNRDLSASEVLDYYKKGADSYTTAKDYSGNENHGSVFKEAIFNKTGGRDGGGAYEFDGVNDYISVTNSSSLNNVGTISLWLRARSLSNTFNVLLAKAPASGSTAV